MIARLWTRRSLAERTALIFLLFAATWRGVIGLVSEGPLESANGAMAFGAAFLVLVIFAVLAVPAAIIVALFGGREFASPWRRTLDRLLPAGVLALLWLAFTAG